MSENLVQRAIAVKRRHEASLLRLPNVVAVGVGRRVRGGAFTDEICIIVSVRKKMPAAQLDCRDLIPTMLDGVPVDVVETGEIAAL
ncbi:MAG: hypothetical protein NZM11_03720 [Anaerolineales bacterium]|nr:hypothetical protein [Anaerolineales bacterium]MDW8325515.1 hypothetical protein [Anaerolineales bacterium]